MQRPQVLKIKHGVSRAAGQPCSLLLLAFDDDDEEEEEEKDKKRTQERRGVKGLGFTIADPHKRSITGNNGSVCEMAYGRFPKPIGLCDRVALYNIQVYKYTYNYTYYTLYTRSRSVYFV